MIVFILLKIYELLYVGVSNALSSAPIVRAQALEPEPIER